jgi:alpha-galactosidase
LDRALYGAPLSLAGKTYAKGLFLPSRTRLVYRLSGKFSRLAALAGIDDRAREARTTGAVRLLIEGDGRTLFDETISAGDAPRPIDLDIAGVKRLTIVADHGDGDWNGDHLDLCEARVTQ